MGSQFAALIGTPSIYGVTIGWEVRRISKGCILALCLTWGCSSTQEPAEDGSLASDRGADILWCKDIQNQLKACRLGTAFAECPGQARPRAFCAALPETSGSLGDARCVWVSNGCPVDVFKVPLALDCTCEGSKCPADVAYSMHSFLGSFGASPWDATTQMTVGVNYDPASPNPSGTRLTCEHCSSTPCTAATSPCGDPEIFLVKALQGTLSVRIFPHSLQGGWYVEVEVDGQATPPRARVCRMPFSDLPKCEAHEPLCATSGEVKLNQPFSSITNQVGGSLEAEFSDGMRLRGSF